MSRILPGVVAVLVAAGTVTSQSSPNAGRTLPAVLDGYLANVVNPTSAERKRLLDGAPITKLLEADGSKEVAVFGAIWINAPIQRYVDAVQNIQTLEKGGGFRVTERISTPPRLEDFARLKLPPEDVEDLRTCRMNDCEVKLSARALRRFRTEVDWTAADLQAAADAMMRKLALEYVQGYLEAGNERLAVYRDHSRPRSVAEEFRAMLDQMPELAIFMPDMRHYLLEYPRVTLPDSTSFLYWQEAEFGVKPTIRISHLTIRQRPDATVVASKMLYASHYFWTGLELRALLPDPSRGAGFWFVTANRSRTDGLSGLTGLFVRRRVRSGVQEGAMTVLRATKKALEQPSRGDELARTVLPLR